MVPIRSSRAREFRQKSNRCQPLIGSTAKAHRPSVVPPQSKEFFSQKEKETTLAGIVYDKGPLSKELTSCDLGGRAMTVGASVAKKNTVGYEPTVQA